MPSDPADETGLRARVEPNPAESPKKVSAGNDSPRGIGLRESSAYAAARHIGVVVGRSLTMVTNVTLRGIRAFGFRVATGQEPLEQRVAVLVGSGPIGHCNPQGQRSENPCGLPVVH
jgi:hypothetical protein